MSKSNLPATGGQNNLNPMQAAVSVFDARKAALKQTQYSARVTRYNPCAIVILIDQSGSMERQFSETTSRAQAVADIVNDLFDNLIMKCQKEGGIRDYFNILVIGYGKEIGDSEVSIIWEGNLAGKDWVTVSELKDNILSIETIETVKMMPWGQVPDIKTKKIWINPCCDGLTPMHQALQWCKNKLEDWVFDKQDSYPPMVFNITDGHPTDIDGNMHLLSEVCSQIKSVGTKDGNALLFNCLLTDGEEIVLPSDTNISEFDDDEYLLALFHASSTLPHEMKNIAKQCFQDDRFLLGDTKGVIINSTVSSLINLLNIGTNTALGNAGE